MRPLFRFAILGLATAFLTGTAQADIVTDWNIKTLELTQAAQASGNAQARTLAMVHVAMSDAINSVKGRYTRYVTNVPMMPAASADAAAASAARTILGELFAKQKAAIDETYASSIKAIPDGESKTQGITLGEQVAAAILADRASDGTAAPDTYRPPCSRS